MNIEEHIRKIIKEETKIPNFVLRRINLVDDMFNDMKNRYSRLFCEYRNPKNLLSVLYERTLSDLYYAWFYEMVTEDEWKDAEKYIEKYLVDKFEKSTMTHWENKCNKRSSISETELTEKCWKGYTQKGMKTMFGKRYPNCVKKTKK